MSDPRPLVFFGSGAFGVPVLSRLAGRGQVALVVSQPDRQAGRGRAPTPTPVAAWALEHGLPLLRCQDANAESSLQAIRAAAPVAFVVIAFGQKLLPALLEEPAGRPRFAINLHGSLLPRWRGAAPIQRAVMEGDAEAGVTVISIAPRMDAGVVYGEARTLVGAAETSGEVHDRLAALGPDLVDDVLRRWWDAGRVLAGAAQDESLATRARKLSKEDAWVDLAAPARLVAARLNGLQPWPGCDALLDGAPLRLCRASAFERLPQSAAHLPPGRLLPDGVLRCGDGAVQLLEVQSPGGRILPWREWVRGHPLGAEAAIRSGPELTRRDR
ncbi:MAG: methionyl-tRNA formyltransferase [Phycisphaerales bacterium]